MRTPYETFEGKPPNLDEIFKFRLGQIVTVTKLSDQRCKTDHNLAGIACYTLHPDNTAHRNPGTWLYCPNPGVDKAYLWDNIDIQEVEYTEIPNQSKVYFRPQGNPHVTYPPGAILKLIDDGIAKGDEATVTPMDTLSEVGKRDQYIGKRVGSYFGKKYYEGIVDHFWMTKKEQILYYHVEYDDKTEQDYTETEIAHMVIPIAHSSSSNSMVMQESEGEQFTDQQLDEFYNTNTTWTVPVELKVPYDSQETQSQY